MTTADEYLPPEHEQTALTAPEASTLQPCEERIRIQCSFCSHEVGYDGLREHAWSLLEKSGWKVGKHIICPACVKKAARKFFRDYQE